MTKHPCDVLAEAFVSKAIPTSKAKFPHHWLDVSSDVVKEKWLKLLRPGDCEKYSSPDFFLSKHGASFVYPLSLFGYYIGFALRSVATKDMRTYVKNSFSACYSAFASTVNEVPAGGVTTIVVEGYSDVEAIANFHPWVIGSMTAHLRVPLIHVVASVSNKIVLAYDNDAPGEKGFLSTKKKFEKLGKKVSRFEYPSNYKDPAKWFEMDKEGIQSAVRRMVV